MQKLWNIYVLTKHSRVQKIGMKKHGRIYIFIKKIGEWTNQQAVKYEGHNINP
jgi:hypothetical protein